ncbi:MAG: peptidoglycan-associated lipoprotein [Betaproteobacteria bacterium]|nr:MAG: peptidoglycan-associated lipoprotein [Betaproteobacteria bacterium]
MRAVLFPLIATSLLFLGACATEPEKPAASAPVEAKPGAKPQAVESKPVARVDATGRSTGSPFAALKDPNNILSKRQIYFDYDKFEVKDEFRSLVEAHAKFLRENPSAKMLTLLGAREDQIESVSLGEEKPVCTDHSEDCYAKNRRDDMLYSGEY